MKSLDKGMFCKLIDYLFIEDTLVAKWSLGCAASHLHQEQFKDEIIVACYGCETDWVAKATRTMQWTWIAKTG